MRENKTATVAPLPAEPAVIVNRITALWAFNEAGLGGLMHAVKSPFTGLLVGGIAIILIALIAYFSDKKAAAILKATVIVLLIKGVVSPHSPLLAYFAVGFQGLAGALIFGVVRSFRPAALILGLAGLLESALQKILTLTLIYGIALWESTDLFINYLLKAIGWSAAAQGFSASILLISLYLGLYFLGGLFVGYLAGTMPEELLPAVRQENAAIWQQLSLSIQNNLSIAPPHRPMWKKRIFKIGTVLAGIIAIYVMVNPELKGSRLAIYVLIRTCVVLAIWFLLLAPLLRRLLNHMLNKKRQAYSGEVEQILSLFPQLRQAAAVLWRGSANLPLLRRSKNFLISMISYSLFYQSTGNDQDK